MLHPDRTDSHGSSGLQPPQVLLKQYQESIYYSWLRKNITMFCDRVFDKYCSYNQMKDIQSCVTAMQNMMLVIIHWE